MESMETFTEQIIPQLWTVHKRGSPRDYLANMPTNATLVLSRNIRFLKEQDDLTLVEIQKRSGVSKSQISYLLNYRDTQDRHPTTQTVEALAHAFGLETWQLMHPQMGRGAAPTSDVGINLTRLTAAIEGAAQAFRQANKLPTDAHLAAAAAYLYAHSDNVSRHKQAQRVVQQQLAKAATPVFPQE